MMRKIVLFSAMLALATPNGLAVSNAAHPAITAESDIAPIKLNLNSPLVFEVDQPDFDAKLAALRQAQAAEQAIELQQAAQTVVQKLKANGLKSDYAAMYLQAQQATGTPWQLIAAVHDVETHQSGTTAVRSYAGAEGPMQFMPGTFAHYALDGNGDGVKDIFNVQDAILTGANYLRAGGAANGNYVGALLTYNHSTAYANYVLSIARRLGLA